MADLLTSLNRSIAGLLLDPEEVAEEVDESAGHRHHREEEGVAEVGVLGPSPHLHTVQYSTGSTVTITRSSI